MTKKEKQEYLKRTLNIQRKIPLSTKETNFLMKLCEEFLDEQTKKVDLKKIDIERIIKGLKQCEKTTLSANIVLGYFLNTIMAVSDVEFYDVEDAKCLCKKLMDNYSVIDYGYSIGQLNVIIKNAYDYEQKIKEQEQEKNKIDEETEKNKYRRGIYGIYVDDELIYIGKTLRSFEQRFEEHRKSLNKEYDEVENVPKLYFLLKAAKDDGKEIKFKRLIDLDDINCRNHRKFDNKDLCNMELGLITVLKPRGNVEGVSMPYRYR